jgi:hypothetical protein
MSKSTFYLLLGICSGSIISGAALLPNSTGTQVVVGIMLVGMGVIAFFIVIVYYETGTLKTSLQSSAAQLNQSIISYTNSLKQVAEQIGVVNDARFIPDGFIGLQRECIAFERNSPPGVRPVRMGVFGHLPSHLRLSPLNIERGMQLFDNWEPPHMIADYIALVNERRDAILAFIKSGGVCREIYEQMRIEQYLSKRYTFHDQVVDPLEEVEERLNALRSLLDYKNYYLCFIPPTEERTGPYYLLKQGVGLIIDLRTTEPERHFTRSVDGLFTNSPRTMDDFERKFERASKTMDRKILFDQVEKYLDIVRTKRREG